MWLASPHRNKKTGEKTDPRYFQCVTYREYGKLKCSVHATNYKALYQLVLQDIRQYAKRALEEPTALLEQLTDMENKERQAQQKQAPKEHKESQSRLAEIKVLLKRLFEENAMGKMNHDNYETMFHQYQKEQEQLTSRCQRTVRENLMPQSRESER